MNYHRGANANIYLRGRTGSRAVVLAFAYTRTHLSFQSDAWGCSAMTGSVFQLSVFVATKLYVHAETETDTDRNR